MAGKGSAPGERRGGRKKGVPNKLTRDVRQAIENAFITVGGESYLARLAKKYPAVFAQLLGKLLPLQITGKDGGPVKTQDVGRGSSEAALLRASELLARALTLGAPVPDAPAHTNGSVLPAEVRAGTNGHGASVDAGQNPGSSE